MQGQFENSNLFSGPKWKKVKKQLAGSMAAAGVDLVPLVEGGSGWLEHDEKLFLQAQATEP